MSLEDQTTLDPSATYDGEPTLQAGAGEPQTEATSEPEQLDRFRLERLLGQGGMGQVWEAWDPQLERPVAIKRLLRADPSARRRFVREARLQATLAHPGICPVFEVGQDAGEPYLVMPRLDGVRLDEAVEGEPLEYKLDLMRQVADAIHAAHQQGLIHRDLKPANILVEHPTDAPPRPVVLDFGIARPVGGEMLTAPGEVVGTPAFMAPEQVEGASVQLDRRTDVYALGATLYRLLCGRPPHTGTGTPLLLSIVHEEPERLPLGDIPAEVEAIVFKCLEKDKSQRYDSARALAEDLERYLAGEPVHARPVTKWIRFGKWARRHRVAVRVTSAATLLAVAGLAWGGWSAWQSGERQEAARRFGAQVEEIEALARYSHLVPLHDVREDRKLLRNRLDAIRPSLDDRDPVIRALASHAMGRGHLALDELEEAREYLETAYELDPENSEIATDLGRTLSEIYRDQLADFERFGDQVRRKELGKQLAGRITRKLKESGRPKTQTQSSIEAPILDLLRGSHKKGTKDSIEIDALILFHQGRPNAALDLLAANPPGNSWAYEHWRLEGDIRRSWGLSLFDENQIDAAREQLQQARRAYKRVLSVAPSHAAILLDDAKAICLLALLSLVSLEEAGSLFEEARLHLHNAHITNPGNPTTWLWMTRLELAAAEHAVNRARDPIPLIKSTISLARKVLQLGGRPSDAWYELGRAHESFGRELRRIGRNPQGQYELAAKALDSVEPADRNYAYYISLGVLEMEIANYRAEKGLDAEDSYRTAIGAFQSAAALHSKPFAAWFNLGVTLFNSASLEPKYRMSILEKAIETFDQAHRLRPKSMLPFYYLGLSRQRIAQEITGDSRLLDPTQIAFAVSDLKRASQLAPDRFEPWVGLAAASRLHAFDAFNRGDEVKMLLAQARQYSSKALDLAPGHSVVTLYAGQIEFLASKSKFRQGLDPTSLAIRSESFCRQSLLANYRANALHCIGDSFSIRAKYQLSLEDRTAARLLISTARSFFEKALLNDEDHIETLQSLPELLILEASLLRQMGNEPTSALKEARGLLEQAIEVSGNEVTTLLIYANWHLESALWLETTSHDVRRSVEAGHSRISEVLRRAPNSTEARSLRYRFLENFASEKSPNISDLY